ncbi:MAG: aquaporin [Acidimicrobiia bacterium]|nr:aquaporin [Acidimicrobiia bacterium]
MTGSLNKYLAELLGAFVLIGVGSMAILSSGGSIVAIAFGFGVALLIALYMFGSVSGGHYNPAVTLAQLIRGEISAADAGGYIVAQLAGAVLAAALVAAALGSSAVGRTVVGDGADLGSIWVLALEALFTAFLVMVILRVTSGENASAPVVIGLTLVVIHLALVPVTGASVNPVRSLGPAIVAADFTDAWAYIVGPLVGGAVAVYVDRFIHTEAS